jgi:riboflavin biosynthesis pyrimidine reductase
MLIELYPEPGVERPLRGLHLEHDLRGRGQLDEPYLATGFIASLDGRIAVGGSSGAPEAIANDRDWRLYQELLMQADVVLSTGRYVRDVTEGRASSFLPDPADPNAADLFAFRRDRGLPERPAVAILSNTGSFDAEVATGLSDEVLLATGRRLDAGAAARFADAGITVVTAGGAGTVDAALLLQSLLALGHRIVFSSAGPRLFGTLVSVTDALYLTTAARLLGGTSYATLLEGAELAVPPSFTLASAHLDTDGPGGASQLFLEFSRRERS